MDIKDCQQYMNIVYNSNIYRERIYQKLLSDNEFNFNETNCILNHLKKRFEESVLNKYISKDDYNNIFPILDHKKVKNFFKNDIKSKRTIKHQYFKTIYDNYLNNFCNKNFKIRDYCSSHDNHFYLKFVINEKFEREKNLDKTFFEYFYNISVSCLNNKNIINNEMNDFVDNIIFNSKSVKIYITDNDKVVEASLELFKNFVFHKKKNIYKINDKINDNINESKKELLDILNNLLLTKTVIINKLGVIKPYGYLNVNGSKVIFDNNGFNFNKKFNTLFRKDIIYDNVGLIFYKNYYKGVTYDHILYYLKNPLININLKEYIEDLFEKILFQLIFTLYRISCYFPNFRHNDLHFKNVIVNSETKNNFYIVDNKIYYIKDVDIKIIDFEMATLGKDNLINNYINNSTFINEYGLSNNKKLSYDIHYILNILYTHNKTQKYKDFVLRHIPPRDYLGRNNVNVNEWRLHRDAILDINYKDILKDKLFRRFKVLKFRK